MAARPVSLWRNPDFRYYWAADTVSIFGSLITRTALPFTAILALDASAIEVALLGLADLLPAVLLGLPVGVWVDRVRRLPLMIGADLARALVLVTVPLAAVLDALVIEHLYLVAAIASGLTVTFNVAQVSVLPAMVGRGQLLEANSKTQATQSVSEVGAFGIAGWLVQVLSGPGAVLLDAASFVLSALLLQRVKLREAEAPVHEERPGMRQEVRDGLRVVMHQPELRAVAISSTTLWFGFRLFGTVISLYALEDLGFSPGVLGMIYGVGGVTSFFGALLAEPVARRFGIGPAMIVGLFMGALSLATLPFAEGAGWVAAGLLVAQQCGDGFVMVYMINETSMRQALAPAAFMGRVNATSVFLTQSAMVLGIIVAGGLGEVAGLRVTMATGAAVAMAGALWLAAGPVRKLRSVDSGHEVERVE